MRQQYGKTCPTKVLPVVIKFCHRILFCQVFNGWYSLPFHSDTGHQVSDGVEITDRHPKG
jgi:hypothetical protein